MNEILSNFIELFYPRICSGCGIPLLKGEQVICLGCHIKLPRTEFGFQKENAIEQLFWGRLKVSHATSFLYYRKSGLAQKLIHELKYKNRPEVGYHLGYLFGQENKESFLMTLPDILTTVPLHPDKLKARGYNQSDEIAKGFSEATGIRFIPSVISRKEFTETQTKKKRYNRWENMSDKFELNNDIIISGKHIFLLDDVITTGATMEACGKVLLSSDNTKLSILSTCFAIN